MYILIRLNAVLQTCPVIYFKPALLKKDISLIFQIIKSFKYEQKGKDLFNFLIWIYNFIGIENLKN